MGFVKLFIYENSSPVINKTLNSRTQKTDARVDVKVTAAVWRSEKTKKKKKKTLSFSLPLLTLQHETARLKIPRYPLSYLI